MLYEIAGRDHYCDTDDEEFALNIQGTGNPDHPLSVEDPNILGTMRRNTLEETDVQYCARHGCPNEAQVGGHIWIRGAREPHVTHLCHACNHYSMTRWFRLRNRSVVVPLVPIRV